ncbi:uncharacterized protein LOC62_07G009714 [Vanrija pseudolonga]|uniref:Uncharacterized protein n=1 Tax=Vanrija pseudolonga TaxID=143232 RepID=A0AAF0YLB1_9TREE|nr:hypothetical protein LOC62_07G009714 [Vanrija pseudolonga]
MPFDDYDDYDDFDDFVSISASDALSDAGGGYTADGDDFVALGTPLSYAHSLRCGLPESTARVYYVPASPILEEEDEEDEGYGEYDDEYEEEDEQAAAQTQHLDDDGDPGDSDNSGSDAETYWDLSFTPTITSCGIVATTDHLAKEGGSSATKSRAASTRPTPPRPRASMAVRLVDANEELHKRLEGRAVVPPGWTRRRPPHNAALVRKHEKAEHAARQLAAQRLAEKDRPYHIVSVAQAHCWCNYKRPGLEWYDCGLGHTKLPPRCLLNLWVDEQGPNAPWWAATMARATRAAPADVVQLVAELASRGRLVPVWVWSGGSDNSDCSAYWAMMDDTAKGLRELLMAGSLPWRGTRDARRALERELRTATLARILDCAPVDGEWRAGEGRLPKGPELKYLTTFHHLLTPNAASTYLPCLRLALVLTSTPPRPPPHDDRRAWHTLRAVKEESPRTTWNGIRYRPYEAEWAPVGPKYFGNRMFVYDLYAHLAADESEVYHVAKSSP